MDTPILDPPEGFPRIEDLSNIPRAEAWENLDELTKNAAKNNPLLSFTELLIEIDEKNKRREKIERIRHEYRNNRSESA